MDGFLNIREKTEKFFSSDKKLKIIVALGILGIALIFLSTFWNGNKKGGQSQQMKDFDSETYIEKLEKKIHTMVSGIQGVGTANVMITLESSTEYVYENERKEDINTTKDYSDGETQKEQERNNYEQNVILVNGSNVNKEALLRTTIEPKVKGVVIVCQGGDNIEVEKSIIDAVTTALDITSNNVCVVKLSEQSFERQESK